MLDFFFPSNPNFLICFNIRRCDSDGSAIAAAFVAKNMTAVTGSLIGLGQHGAFAHVAIWLLVLAGLLMLAAIAVVGRRPRFAGAALLAIVLGTTLLYAARHLGAATATDRGAVVMASQHLIEHRQVAAEATASFTLASVLFAVILLLVRLRLRLQDIDLVISISAVACYVIGLAQLLSAWFHGRHLISLGTS